MTFREFNIAMIRDPILGKLLPLQLRRTFPWLSVEGENLFASFVGFRIVREGDAVKAFDPAYYVKIAYPKCTVQSYEKFPILSNSRRLRTTAGTPPTGKSCLSTPPIREADPAATIIPETDCSAIKITSLLDWFS